MYLGFVIAGLIAAFALELLIVGIVPGFSVPKQSKQSGKKTDSAGRPSLSPRRGETQSGSKKNVRFDVKGTPVSAWLYLPENLPAPFPCIVMAHGLGATRDVGLESYALRFREVGLAVLVFDYRHLGQSGGEPRQLVWIPYQLQDYGAAVDYARSLPEIDSEKIALWGTSLSGGHVLVTAAGDSRIACVSAQVPLLDGGAGQVEEMKREGIGRMFAQGLRLLIHAQRDLVRSWLGLSPHRIPLFGKPDTIAIMPDAGAWKLFEELTPDDFINEACARILIRIDKYRPIKYLDKLRCPVLLQVCERDIALPTRVVEEAEKRLGGRAEVIRYPLEHFDIYMGSNLVRSIDEHLAFFKKHLLKNMKETLAAQRYYDETGGSR